MKAKIRIILPYPSHSNMKYSKDISSTAEKAELQEYE